MGVVADRMSSFSVARTTSPASSDWLSAEEEKKRLYEKAQATARKTQARALASGSAPTETAPAPNSKDIVNPYTFAPTPSMSSGADLYKSAMKSVKTPAAAPVPASTPPRVQSPPIAPPQTSSSQYTHYSEYSTSGSGTSSGSHPPPAASASAFPTAEEEKARLRYDEAKKAVDRHQATMGGSSASGFDAGWEPSPPQPYSSPPPIQGYASPQGVTNGPQLARQSSLRTPGSPPPFSTPVMGYSAESDLPGKEKIRFAFAKRDATLEQQMDVRASLRRRPPPGDPPTPFNNAPSPSSSFIPLTAVEEKVRLRAQYEAEEAAGRAGAGGSGMRSPPPRPSSCAGETRPLTAAEEKAMLKARMAAEQPLEASPPAPPPRLKSPPPAAGRHRLPYLTNQGTGSSASDITPRDPVISAGKQRAAPNANLPALGGLGRAPSINAPFVAPLTSDPASISEVLRDEQGTRDSSVGGPPIPGSLAQSTWLQTTGPAYLGSPQSDFGLGLRPFSPIDLSLEGINKGNKPLNQPASANA